MRAEAPLRCAHMTFSRKPQPPRLSRLQQVLIGIVEAIKAPRCAYIGARDEEEDEDKDPWGTHNDGGTRDAQGSLAGSRDNELARAQCRKQTPGIEGEAWRNW
ncbi:hypothetical protein HYQ46_006309 [Verticillium longisporum]|nr:hypothetical protein HYQ46_006309 [Verticillium longisporum]